MVKILFIINPLSEKNKKINISHIIKKKLDVIEYQYDIKYSEYSGHAYELAETYKKDYSIIVAVGGDGTVNHVSKALVHTDTFLGIIPIGSGNGLARSLRIPLKINKAIDVIIKKNWIRIDAGRINQDHFINMAGIGFDAEIAHSFSVSDQRGFKTYILEVVKKFCNYTVKDYIIHTEGKEMQLTAFLISIANSSQYGNNAHICPKARVNDGVLDVCVMKKFPLWKTPLLAARLFLKNMDKSKYAKIFQTTSASIRNNNTMLGHIDGEPVVFEKKLDISVIKEGVNVIVS